MSAIETGWDMRWRNKQLEPIAAADTAGSVDPPSFTFVRRGYDPVQVNQYLAQPVTQRGPVPEFDVIRRGYAPTEVDAYLRRFQG